MNEEYRQILSRGISRKQQFQQLVRDMRGFKDKKVQALFAEAHEEAFSQIDCLDCANCCAGTGPLLNKKDCSRLAGEMGMKATEFYTAYLRTDEEGDWIFSSLPCPFLLQDNRCLFYDIRPKACREFPHTDQRYIHRYLPQTLKNAEICPAVVLMFEYLLQQ
ncbi:MAG: YkgJ family cysteine cluster protein [Spirochaetales bacterium]|nr:YkgJ family cysteine cluster protein [Spirochaetales bacterium]